jgi:DNA-binding transcriptional LysR family regulator
MVLAGVGISCVLRRAVERDIAVGDIVELDVAMPPLYLDLRLARHGRLAEVDKFVQVIRKVEFQD